MILENGGVCSPKGFKAAGAATGIKAGNSGLDMALIVSDVMCSAAAVYTQNKVCGAPITVTRRNIADGRAQAVICNSGNANTCAPGGIELAEKVCEMTGDALNLKAEDIVVASTGVIGQKLNIEPFEKGIPMLADMLSAENGQKAAQAIMTTDTVSKSIAVEFQISGVTCTIGAIAKGSGMINPNMATMLSFITTDTAITSEMLQKALSEDIKTSYNQICVDGDTSTNDTVAVLANGLAGNPVIDGEGEAFDAFCEALNQVTVHIARCLARDGEGATKLIECNVEGAPDDRTAQIISKSVIASDLLKAAVFGADANWGRVLCAIGYSGADVDITKIDVSFRSKAGEIIVCKNGAGVEFSEEKAKEILLERDIEILVSLGDGNFSATAWGCDLTYDYVKINGDYRT